MSTIFESHLHDKFIRNSTDSRSHLTSYRRLNFIWQLNRLSQLTVIGKSRHFICYPNLSTLIYSQVTECSLKLIKGNN